MLGFRSLVIVAVTACISFVPTSISAHQLPVPHNGDAAQVFGDGPTFGFAPRRGAPSRHLRALHNGEDHGAPAPAGPALVPGPVPAPVPAKAPAPAADPVPAPAPISAATPPSNPSPGSSTTTTSATSGTTTTTSTTSGTTTVNVTPGTINQQINVSSGSPESNANPAPAPAPAQAPPMNAGKPSPPSNPGTSGMNFGSLLGGFNPLTAVATMAHEAHGALLGHTGTVPSAYMQGQSGGHAH